VKILKKIKQAETQYVQIETAMWKKYEKYVFPKLNKFLLCREMLLAVLLGMNLVPL
jgi:hypothetical protein